VELGVIDTPGYAWDVHVVGNLAYIADGEYELRIIDVSNSSAPVAVGAVGTPGEAFAVAVVGDLAFVAGRYGYPRYDGWLSVIDVSNPAVPLVLGTVDTPDYAYDVAVADGLAYVAGYQSGLRVIDVSNPAAPVALASLNTPGLAAGTEVVGNLVYVADGFWGVRIIDVSNVAFPVELGELDTPGDAQGVELVDNLAYVASGSTLSIIDVSDPASPMAFGSLYGYCARDVAVAAGRAYLTCPSGPERNRSGWLSVIDVSNPAIPVALGKLVLPDYGLDVDVVGNLAYVANYRSGLRIFDVSNPKVPVEIGALDTRTKMSSVKVVDNLAYVVDDFGLRIIDVSNSAFPVELAMLEIYGAHSRDVEVVGSLAYVASGVVTSGGWLHIIDISNPTVPVILGVLNMPGKVYDVEVEGDVAYVADGNEGLAVIDVSNPRAPVELGAFGSWTNRVAALGHLAYVTDNDGLRIIDFGPEYTSSLEIDIDIRPDGEPNSIHLEEGGVIPVAILGSESFDVSDVDGTTLHFGPGGAPLAHWRGPHPQDVNGDGRMDLVAHFRAEATGIEYGDRMACLSGETLDGKRFEGCDSIRTVPDMDGDSLLDVDEAAIGTHPLRFDSDGDGYGDGTEVLLMGTDPLDPLDPKPVDNRERRGAHKRRR
jgi:hypothetical protein